jgi:hypothetical protein
MGSTRNPMLDAENAVRQRHFAPAKKDGRSVPVVVTVEVPYERDKGENVIISSHPPNSTGEASKP